MLAVWDSLNEDGGILDGGVFGWGGCPSVCPVEDNLPVYFKSDHLLDGQTASVEGNEVFGGE